MRIKIQSLFLFLPLALMLVFSACQKEENPDNDLQSALDNSFAESEFDALRKAFDIEAQFSDDLKKTGATEGLYCPCSVVTVNANADSTYTMVIDFGSGCACLDGRTRSGKLTGIFSDKWNVAGSAVEVTPDNFKVTALNGKTYDFDFWQKITYDGPDMDGDLLFTVEVQDAVLSSGQDTIRWESTRTTEWIEGIGDLNPTTNVYLVTGTASGTDIKGRDFTAQTDSPLRVEISCPHIVSGSFTLLPQGLLPRSIDYGNGNCDNKATLTIGNYTATITLY
jgi:hypothetical protein